MYKANFFRDKKTLQVIPNDKPGYYRWWAEMPEFYLILRALDIDYEDIAGNTITENFYCAPFISYSKFNQYYNENERRNRNKQNVLNKHAEEDLQSDINKLNSSKE